MTEITDKKQFEKGARTLLKHNIGHNIEESREKLRALIADRMGRKLEKR